MFSFAARSGDELWVFGDDGGVERLPVQRVTAEAIVTRTMSVPRTDTSVYWVHGGGRLWLARLTLPAQITAEEVRALTDNAVLSSVFSPESGRLSVPWPIWGIIAGLLLVVMFK